MFEVLTWDGRTIYTSNNYADCVNNLPNLRKLARDITGGDDEIHIFTVEKTDDGFALIEC